MKNTLYLIFITLALAGCGSGSPVNTAGGGALSGTSSVNFGSAGTSLSSCGFNSLHFNGSGPADPALTQNDCNTSASGYFDFAFYSNGNGYVSYADGTSQGFYYIYDSIKCQITATASGSIVFILTSSVVNNGSLSSATIQIPPGTGGPILTYSINNCVLGKPSNH